MSPHAKLASTSLSAMFFLVCLAPGLPAAAADEGAAGEDTPEEISFSTYYAARIDVRRCAAPRCGGFFVAGLNNLKTLCPNGQTEQECYVADVDFSALGAAGGIVHDAIGGRREDTRVILMGDLDAGSESLGRLVVRMAWVAPENVVLRGTFVKVKDNGIVCVAAPCPSYDEETLNLGQTKWIHGVNLDEVPSSEKERELAYQAYRNPHGLLLAGDEKIVEDAGPAGAGTFFHANQFFLPISPTRGTPRVRLTVPTIRLPRLPIPER